VKDGHGVGVEIAPEIDEVIQYAGEKVIVTKSR
jgi:hypothetical protein